MKKVLLSTSAIALVGGFAGSAAAAEWEVRVGGFSTQSFAYANVDTNVENEDGNEPDFDGVDVLSDTEIIFRPSITLDNGIQFGVQVQLEGNTSDDQIDESFAFVEGSFGRVLIGSENSAGYTMTFAAPCVALNCHNSGTLTAYVPYLNEGLGDDAFRGTLGATFLENARNNDAQRITYFTPRLAGVQLGFSYARDEEQDSSSAVDLDEELGNFLDFGANYVNSFGGFDVAVSGRYGIALNDGDSDGFEEDPEVFAFGANIGFAGFTVGGSWGEQNNANEDDGQGYDVGVSYETGPWGFSFSYFHGENVDDEAFDDGFSNDEELDKFVAAVNYTLADGVDLGVYGAFVDFEEDSFEISPGGEDGPITGGGGEMDGFVIGTGMALSF